MCWFSFTADDLDLINGTEIVLAFGLIIFAKDSIRYTDVSMGISLCLYFDNLGASEVLAYSWSLISEG
jgi:hypothetical protein